MGRARPLGMNVALVFVEAGEKIDTLLSGRALVEANVALREEAHALRGGALQQLGNFRNALRDELKSNAGLPRNLEELIFGYFDELAAQREKSSGKGPGKKDEPGGEK